MGGFPSLLRQSGGRDEPRGYAGAVLHPSTRILIVAEARVHREALEGVLVSCRMGLVSTTAPGEALQRVSQDEPHVVLLDVPPDPGLTLTTQLRAAATELKSIVIGVSEKEADVVAWAEAGVAGYVTVDDSVDDLIATISSVLRGETRCSPGISAALLRRVETLASAAAVTSLGALTARETQVADLLVEGLSNKEIALCLSIALPTVKAHVHSILSKVDARRRGEVVAHILRATRTAHDRNN